MVIEDSTNGIILLTEQDIFCAAYKSEHSKLQKYDLANIVVTDFSDLEPQTRYLRYFILTKKLIFFGRPFEWLSLLIKKKV